MSEERPTHYLEQERERGGVSLRRGKRLTGRVRSWKRRWFGRKLTLLTVRQPTLSVLAFLVPLVVVGGASLWVFALREARPSDSSDSSLGAAKSQIASPSGFPPGFSAPGAVNVPGPKSTSPPEMLGTVWKADKWLIAPGEALVITFTVENVWDRRIGFTVLPSTATFRRADVDDGDTIHVELRCDEDVPVTLETGEEMTFIANITSDMSAGLRPGRYYGFTEVSFVTSPEDPEKHETGMGFGSGILFVITPS